MAAFTDMHYTTTTSQSDGGGNPMDAMRDMLGPGHVDQMVRGAVQACWMALPKERRSVEEVEKQIRRLLERALSNMHEDIAAFGERK